MNFFPFAYEPVAATTWAFMSSLLLLVVFFKFNRFWSVRNLDLLLIILLAPGILLIAGGRKFEAMKKASMPGVAAPSQTDPASMDKGLIELSDRNNIDRAKADGVLEGDDLKGGTDASQVDPKLRQESEDLNSNGIPAQDSSSDLTVATDPSNGANAAGSGDGNVPPESQSNSDLGAMTGSVDGSLDGLTDPSADALAVADIAAIDLSSPGVRFQRLGYIWLFAIGILLMIRMLLDPTLVRRPVLEPNLTIGGLVFLGFSLMLFLFANVITSNPTLDDIKGARNAVKLVQREATEASDQEQLRRRGPGYALLNLLPIIPSFNSSDEMLKTDVDRDPNKGRYIVAAKSLAITGQVLIVLGLVLIGNDLFNNFKTGVTMATVYLVVPYTAVYTGHVDHCLPAAFMVWAIVCCRRPFVAGACLGMATGIAYYPLFLSVLWFSFYWKKGKGRFLIGFLVAIGFCVAGLTFTSTSPSEFAKQLQNMSAFWLPLMDDLGGIWALGWDRWYRVPLLAAFIVLVISFAFWPLQKTIGTLIAYTAVLMLGVQFWHGFGGGEFVAWYLPMLLMTFFRPNLEGRDAESELMRIEEERQLRREPVDILPVD